MKIAHFIPSIDISTGGPARSVTHLIKKLLELSNCNITLFTGVSSKPILLNFNSKNATIFFVHRKKIGFLDFENDSLNNFEIFHGHGIWQMPVHQMAKFAQKINKPYLITPRGMLEPWSLSQGSIKKKIAMTLFQRRDLAKAACIHATATMEADNIRKLGFKNPIAVIPNGIFLEKFSKVPPNKRRSSRKALFLSRIHKKKGIENLIHVWSALEKEVKEHWVLDIVGNGEKKYVKELQELIDSKNLSSEIQIKEPIFGESKNKAFREANLFVLPTFSENFGIVIAEALASYTPVITTVGTPWQDLQTYKCGWWIEIGQEPLKRALIQAMTSPEEKLIAMGKNGRQLIENKYSMKSVAIKMNTLYQWLTNSGQKPDFVTEWQT